MRTVMLIVLGLLVGYPAREVIAEPDAEQLVGCWRHDNEQWTFRRDGKRLIVVRDAGDPSYADRARIPRDVSYDPKAKTHSFAAAGRIHALIMKFQITSAGLDSWAFSTHDGKSYHWTGSRWTMTRARKST